MFLVHIVSAQYPETLSHYALVNARDLDKDFLLFTPDTTIQILINPARAYKYSKSFIYTNYNNSENTTNSSFPTRYNYVAVNSYISSTGEKSIRKNTVYLYSGTNLAYTNAVSQPAFSIIALFNSMDSKWLLNLSYDVAQSNGDDDESRTELYEKPDDEYYLYENRFRTDLHEITANYSYANIALSKIGVSVFGNYSIGIFASYKQDDCEDIRAYNYNYDYIYYS